MEAGFWKSAVSALPWTKVWRVNHIHELLPLLQNLQAEFGGVLRVVLTWLDVYLTLCLKPPPRGLVQPLQWLHIKLIVSKTWRRGNATRALEELVTFSTAQGWGLTVNGPFNERSRGWLTKLSSITTWHDDGWGLCALIHNGVAWQTAEQAKTVGGAPALKKVRLTPHSANPSVDDDDDDDNNNAVKPVTLVGGGLLGEE